MVLQRKLFQQTVERLEERQDIDVGAYPFLQALKCRQERFAIFAAPAKTKKPLK